MVKTPAKKRTKPSKNNLISLEDARNRLKLRQIELSKSFQEKYPHVERYLKEKGLELQNIRKHSARVISAGALTGTLLLSPPTNIKSLPSPSDVVLRLGENFKSVKGNTPQEVLVDTLAGFLPERPRPLTREEEKYLENIFGNIIGVKTKGTLEGEHLNTTYGYIGAEQHLRRYPGDALFQHGEGEVIKEGIAPGLGAWGYFSFSKEKLTPDLEETERWYAVVQTLYLPDWNTRQPYLRDWYKYRKVLIVNTDNGNAVVAAIADSGPAIWTGKQFGGSPEVMHYLGGERYKKGKVLLFFVDDPENKVPLGPVEYNKLNISDIALHEV